MSTSPSSSSAPAPPASPSPPRCGRAACPPSCSSGPTTSAPPGGGTTSGCTCTPPAAGRACRACRSRAATAGGSRARTSSTTSRCTPCTTGSTCAPGVQVTRVDAGGDGSWVGRDRRRGRRSRAPTVVVATGYNHTPVPPRVAGRRDVPGRARARVGVPERRRRTAAGTCSSSAPATPGRRSRSTSPRAGRRGCGSPSARRRTSSGARTSAGPRRAPGSWCATCPCPVVDRDRARRRPRRGAGPVVVRAAAADHRALLARAWQGSVPLQDVGLIAAVQARPVEPVAAVESFDDGAVVLADGSRITPDVVIAATGYRRGLEPLVGDLGVLDERGLPRVHGPRTSRSAPGPLLHRVHQPDQRHVPRAADRRRADRARRSAAR